MNLWKKFCRGIIEVLNLFLISCGIVVLVLSFVVKDVSFEWKEIQQICIAVFSLVLVLKKSLDIWNYNRSIDIPKQVVERKSLPELETVIYRKRTSEEEQILEYNKKVNAAHEAGHAVMAYLVGMQRVRVILSGVPRTEVFHQYLAGNESRIMIYVKYAGAIAEEMILGKFHNGCFGSETADFEHAAKLIKGYIVMSNPEMSKSFLDSELAEKIIELSKRFWEDAEQILRKHQEIVLAEYKELLKKDELSEKELKKIFESLDTV